jgi:glycosyltransferase involved in cell wall biosynthesis
MSANTITIPAEFDKQVLAGDPELQLLIPAADIAFPELSIVIPALNEKLTIARFLTWCKEGLASAGVQGEIIIVDSSTDETAEIALSLGARVLRTPKRGLGRAYIDAIPFIRGKYVLMGDADCTYDFRQIAAFVEKFSAGYEFVMGSRFRGYIEPDSMPPLHRYFGTPVTTRILNVLYRSSFSDIHCGMRGITKEALQRIEIESQSWEYASEMVLKAVCFDLKTAEVPVRFLKEPAGRFSHMKRNGWREPWRAGWINLKAMLLYGSDFFLLRPGLVLLALGLMMSLPATFGPVPVGPVVLSTNWMMLGLTLSVVGLQSFCLGCIAQVLYAYIPESPSRWRRVFAYDRAMITSAVLLTTGAAFCIPLAKQYIQMDLTLPLVTSPNTHLALTGLLLLICGFLIFTNALVIHAAGMRVRARLRLS